MELSESTSTLSDCSSSTFEPFEDRPSDTLSAAQAWSSAPTDVQMALVECRDSITDEFPKEEDENELLYSLFPTVRICGETLTVHRTVVSQDRDISGVHAAFSLSNHLQPHPPDHPQSSSGAFLAVTREPRQTAPALFEQLPTCPVNLAGVAGVIFGVTGGSETTTRPRRPGSVSPLPNERGQTPGRTQGDLIDFPTAYRKAVESLRQLNEGLE